MMQRKLRSRSFLIIATSLIGIVNRGLTIMIGAYLLTGQFDDE